MQHQSLKSCNKHTSTNIDTLRCNHTNNKHGNAVAASNGAQTIATVSLRRLMSKTLYLFLYDESLSVQFKHGDELKQKKQKKEDLS